jgi:hypothetical protein
MWSSEHLLDEDINAKEPEAAVKAATCRKVFIEAARLNMMI